MESNLRTPNEKPVLWDVYKKICPSIRTQVSSKYWFEARNLGSRILMISLEECEAEQCLSVPLANNLQNITSLTVQETRSV
jgi:hypothetical protein